jgi:hypothetical protein
MNYRLRRIRDRSTALAEMPQAIRRLGIHRPGAHAVPFSLSLSPATGVAVSQSPQYTPPSPSGWRSQNPPLAKPTVRGEVSNHSSGNPTQRAAHASIPQHERWRDVRYMQLGNVTQPESVPVALSPKLDVRFG